MQGGYSGIPPYLHSPVYAAQQLGLEVAYATGPIVENQTDAVAADAVAAAKSSDIVLYFGGIDSTIEGEALDRYSVAWASGQLSLINQLSTLGKPLIVLKMGGQLDDTPLLTNFNISGRYWGRTFHSILCRLRITMFHFTWNSVVLPPTDCSQSPATSHELLPR